METRRAFAVRLNAWELARLRLFAEKAGQNMSQYVRERCGLAEKSTDERKGLAKQKRNMVAR